jgi:hypothetical protein
MWSDWVDHQIGGDEWRRRTALEAALQALQTGRSADEAASAARAAVGPMPPPGMPPQQMAVRCRFCGSAPAVPMTIYEHNGFIILMQFKHVAGPFCRSCGLHVWRRMTNTTLLRGWLGFLSFFIAPATAVINLINLRKLTGLSAPDPAGAARQPADPGPSMFRRAGVYVYAAVLLVVILVYVVPR